MPNFTCSALLWILRLLNAFRVQDFYSLRWDFPIPSAMHSSIYRSPQPQSKDWFGLFPVRSPLLRESIFLSLPEGTEMFQFPSFPSLRLYIHLRMTGLYSSRVAPFGYPWIVAYVQLPAAFRSLSRPSSAPSAKASALCSFSLDQVSCHHRVDR